MKAASAREVSTAPATRRSGLPRLNSATFARGGLILLLLLIHFGASQLGFALHLQPPSIAFVHPAAGVLVGGLALVPARDRPWLLAGAFALVLLQNITSGYSPAAAIVSALAKIAVGAVVIAIYAIRHWPLQLGTPKQIGRFVAAIAIACALAGLVALPTLARGGDALQGLLRWFMADMIGIIAVAPPFFALKLPAWHRRINGESILAIACGVALSAVIFLTPPTSPGATQHLPVSLIFLMLYWCGARCSPLANAILLFLFAMIAIYSVTVGLGPFSSLNWPVSRRIFAVQNVVLVASAGTLLLSILFAERRDREAKLAKALEAQKALLYEVNHRVKNSLQLATSVLTIEATKLDDPAARAALQTAQSRIAIIARLHRHLYSTERHATVHLDEVLQETVESVLRSAGRDDVTLVAAVESGIAMDVGTAIPVALATAEIITNAVKHAYPVQGGPIHLSLTRDRSTLVLQVRDQGAGFAGGDADKADRIGMRIIRDLFRQLDAVTEIETTAAGTSFVVRIPYDESPIPSHENSHHRR